MNKQYYEVTNGVITNVPVVDFDIPASYEFAETMPWILDVEGFGIGDFYEDGVFKKAPIPPISELDPSIIVNGYKNQLTEIDQKSVRSLRAVASGVATEEDTKTLIDLETEAEKIRIELAGAEIAVAKFMQMKVE